MGGLVVTHFEPLELIADRNRDSLLPLRMRSCPAVILNAVKDLETKRVTTGGSGALIFHIYRRMVW
jgi:hypothetical protein